MLKKRAKNSNISIMIKIIFQEKIYQICCFVFIIFLSRTLRPFLFYGISFVIILSVMTTRNNEIILNNNSNDARSENLYHWYNL